MTISLLYVILAILGLSFLIFIHELGHYYMARLVGMRVETFSIGFGRPLYSWEKDGVKWQIGWLLFGGYVKIAGMDMDKDVDALTAEGSFYSKSPLDRIKVAFMGPFVNLVFAIVIFTLLWLGGGRNKNFSDFTHKIGWVDTNSALYQQGVRPGDEISTYNSTSFQAAKDHLYAPMTANGELIVKGFKVNYTSAEKHPFEIKVKPYSHPAALEKGLVTSGILAPGSYIIYGRHADGQENPLPEGSPLEESGIQYGDRLVWLDGELIFSVAQLNQLLNDSRALLTISRNNERILRRVPRVQIQELKLSPELKEELVDWQFEAQLNNEKFQNLFMIPYDLTNDCKVQDSFRFIDKDNENQAFPKYPYSELEEPLQPGDKIIAIDGYPVFQSYQLFEKLQTNTVNLIVQRSPHLSQTMMWNQADDNFDKGLEWQTLDEIIESIGSKNPLQSAGNFVRLNPVVPKMRSEFRLSPEKQALLVNELQEQKKMIEAVEDPEIKAHALRLLDSRQKQLLLGLPTVQDRKVEYNPTPLELFSSVFAEIWRTLSALFTGSLNPKWISGPIGIVQVVHDNSMLSLKEGLFWLGAISLNLGVLNLLPIPMLDGGTILISLVELFTKRRFHPKTLERLIIPFAILLIGFFVFLTYNDLSRLFGGFLH